MQALLTPGELAAMVAAAERTPGGLILLTIPDHVIRRKTINLVLAHPQIVRYDDRHARLSSLHFAVIRYLLANTSATVDELIESVWLRKDSERAISQSSMRQSLSRLNRRLTAAGIPWRVAFRNSVIFLEKIQNHDFIDTADNKTSNTGPL